MRSGESRKRAGIAAALAEADNVRLWSVGTTRLPWARSVHGAGVSLQLLQELVAAGGLHLVGSLDLLAFGLLWPIDDSGELHSNVAEVLHIAAARASSASRKVTH